MNRRNFLRAATGCAVAGVAAPVVAKAGDRISVGFAGTPTALTFTTPDSLIPQRLYLGHSVTIPLPIYEPYVARAICVLPTSTT